MSINNTPMFERFISLCKHERIENWTANDFWKNLKLKDNELNSYNRQRMYRLLRKLVEESFLTKVVHPYDSCLSTFSETEKIRELRNFPSLSIDFIHMKALEEETKNSIQLLEKQMKSFVFLEKKFPKCITQIKSQKTKCMDKLLDQRAYHAALRSVLATF